MKQLFKILALSFLGLTATKTVHAAGYQLNEYSTTNMGRSFAGIGVAADDFSAIGYNPAGMILNKTNGVQGSASWVRIHSTFKGNDGAGRSGHDQTSISRVLPAFFAQYRFNDDLTAGIGLYTPFGLATDYPNGWFGERHGALSEITVVNLSPAIAYRLNEIFSIGAAVNFQYAKAHLTSSISDVRGDDTAMGFSVGLTAEPMKELRFGLSFRSKVTHELEGDLKRLTSQQLGNLTGDVDANITTPEVAILSGAWDMTDKWTLSGTARWTRWKRFDTLKINLDIDTPMGPTHMTSITEEKWRNTGFFALGLDYKATDKWTIRGGVGYDMTVIRTSDHRTPRIPDGRRTMGSLGISYNYKNVEFDAGYTHIFIVGGHSKGTDNQNAAIGRPNIKYSSDANMLSLGIQYKF